MLKEVLSISGRPGLFKLISYAKNLIVVESLLDGKRSGAHSRDKVIALGDIAIYTTGEDKPLGEVLQAVFEKYKGKELDLSKLKEKEQLQAFLKGVLPEYDEDRVYTTDIKKLAGWYNILVKNGMTNFLPKEEEKAADEADSSEEKKA